MRITIIVTEEEHGELKRRAGAVPLGRWLRLLGLGEDVKTPVEVVARGRVVPAKSGRLSDKGVLKPPVPSAEVMESAVRSGMIVAGMPKTVGSFGLCDHGAEKWKCKKWGCPNYEYAR
jgi:hypothetical protein